MKKFKINIIGDIAGRFDELVLLLDKMPKADMILSLGDIVDRGPKSKQVVQWFLDNQDKALSLYGNHEDLMIEACGDDAYRNTDLWYYNGGFSTVQSYGGDISLIPQEHIKFIKSRPLFYHKDNLFATHAPMTYRYTSDLSLFPKYSFSDNYSESAIWNRIDPLPTSNNHFMVFGHNALFKEIKNISNKTYALCLDDSRHKVLTGLHWNGSYNTDNLYTQSYL